MGDQGRLPEEAILGLRFEGQRKVGNGREPQSIPGDVDCVCKDPGDRVNVAPWKNCKAEI